MDIDNDVHTYVVQNRQYGSEIGYVEGTYCVQPWPQHGHHVGSAIRHIACRLLIFQIVYVSLTFIFTSSSSFYVVLRVT